MLDRINRSKILTIAFISGVILVFDIFTIITNAFAVPYLDGYGLPDIFIYIKATVFLFILVILLVWAYNKDFNITRTNLKIIVYFGLVTIIAYYFSLFMYKYLLLLDTQSMIKYKILMGNPATVFDFAAQSYQTVTYLVAIFSGFNGEAILFVEGMVFLTYALKVKDFAIIEEPTHMYDSFMFDKLLFPSYILLAISSFLSINIINYKYDIYGAYEMGVAMSAFVLVIPGIIMAYKIYRTQNHPCTRSEFVGWNKLLMILSVVSVILFLVLTSLDVIFFLQEVATYRIITAAISLLISIFIFFRIRRVMSLENK